MWGMTYLLLPCSKELCSVDPSNDFDGQFEMFVLTLSQLILIFHPNFKEFTFTSLSVLSVCVESFFRVSNKIIVTIFTVSGGGGALGLGEALENRVGPLVEGGELKRLEGADGQTGESRATEGWKRGKGWRT